MRARVLRIVWAVMAAVVAVTFLRRGADARFATACLAYATGWLLLTLALARDPGAVELQKFSRSAAARAAGAAALVLLLAVGLATSVPAMLETLLALATGALAIWVARPRAPALARMVGRLLLVAGTVLLCLAAGEIVVRLPPVFARVGGGVAGLHRWGRENLDALGLQSQLSFRSFHLDRPRAPETFRILALGDSFTWGVGIARTGDVWPYVLERNLQTSSRPIEVISAGVPTYTTVNEAEVLATRGWSFEPDMVVLQFTLNDPLPSGPNLARVNEEWLYKSSHLLPLLDDALKERSFLYGFLDTRFRALQVRRNPRGLAPLFDEAFDGWRASRAAIREMAAASRQRHVPMLLMLFPYFVQGKLDESSYPYMEVHRKVMAAAHDAGIPAIDLRPLFASANPDGSSWWALPYDAHPSVEGQRLAGEALAAKLRELNWVPPGGVATR